MSGYIHIDTSTSMSPKFSLTAHTSFSCTSGAFVVTRTSR